MFHRHRHFALEAENADADSSIEPGDRIWSQVMNPGKAQISEKKTLWLTWCARTR
jgi:hypothetical protein